MSDNLTPCPSCGYHNRPSANRCGLCGTPFVALAGEATLAAAATYSRRVIEGEEPLPVRRDFAAEIRSNKVKSAILLGLCLALLLAMGASVGAWYRFPRVGMVVGLLIGLGVMLWSYYSGDSAILSTSLARPADPDKDRQVINVVDEMRIAAGLPMPTVMILDTDAANAFATGRDPEHATIAVTSGLEKLLNREEMQGVVAHEMSHVRNFDIRYMMLVAALVGAIVLMSEFVTRSWWWGGFGGGGRRSSRSDRSGGGGGTAILAILGVVLVILAPLFASLLQMAVSRKREFLADASAVELTRNPLALASALEKIDNHLDREPLPGASKATQHIYIANPLKSFGMHSSALMSTHPPMEARIKLLRAMG